MCLWTVNIARNYRQRISLKDSGCQSLRDKYSSKGKTCVLLLILSDSGVCLSNLLPPLCSISRIEWEDCKYVNCPTALFCSSLINSYYFLLHVSFYTNLFLVITLHIHHFLYHCYMHYIILCTILFILGYIFSSYSVKILQMLRITGPKRNCCYHWLLPQWVTNFTFGLKSDIFVLFLSNPSQLYLDNTRFNP